MEIDNSDKRTGRFFSRVKCRDALLRRLHDGAWFRKGRDGNDEHGEKEGETSHGVSRSRRTEGVKLISAAAGWRSAGWAQGLTRAFE